MQSIVNPKCQYCHKEFKAKSAFDNPLSGLYGQYCSNSVRVVCPFCGHEYFVSKQTRFIARKNK